MAGKSFDAKAFLVNHTEKLILGAAGLMVLAFLGGSQWTSYKGTPSEITDKVDKNQRDLVNHAWPEEEQLKYEMTQKRTPKQVVHDNLRNPIAVSQYQMSTQFISSPWQGKEPLREPSLLTLEDALATAGRVLIERPLDPTKEEEAPESDPKKKGPGKPGDKPEAAPVVPDPDSDFESSRPAVAGVGPGASAPGAILPGTELPAYNGAPATESSPASTMMEAYGQSGYGSSMPGGGGLTLPKREAQGYYFASVRAVFPVKEQIRKYQDAIHARTADIASFSFEVIDFTLERQEQIGTTDTWTEFQKVDTQSAFDVLDQALPPEPDIVSGTVTNNVITMPLPPRIWGNWRKVGSHPRIDNFVLSNEQVEQEVEYQAKLLELMREGKKNQKLMNPRPKAEKRGFSSRVGDSRELQSDLFGGSAYGSGMTSMYGGGVSSPGGSLYSGGPGAAPMGMPSPRPARAMPGGAKSGAPGNPNDVMKKLLESDDKDAQSKALKEYIEQRVTADGELLLFRYLDFTVESGKSYRYRVRLELNNPNFGHLASEANGETTVVQGETRLTDWSNVTEPVTIERDIYYFVKDVDTKYNRTKVSIYQWDTKLGTTVNADIDLYPGQHIAGTVKTSVIDPAKSTFKEDEPYPFTSSDVFVDTNADVTLDKTLHKDMKLPGGSKGDAWLPEEVLVVQSGTGELAVLDPVRQATEQKRLEDYQKSQAKHFESLKASAAPAMEMMGGSGEDMYNPYSQPAKKGARGKGGRASNPLSGNSMMGAGMPGRGVPSRPTGP